MVLLQKFINLCLAGEWDIDGSVVSEIYNGTYLLDILKVHRDLDVIKKLIFLLANEEFEFLHSISVYLLSYIYTYRDIFIVDMNLNFLIIGSIPFLIFIGYSEDMDLAYNVYNLLNCLIILYKVITSIKYDDE